MKRKTESSPKCSEDNIKWTDGNVNLHKQTKTQRTVVTFVNRGTPQGNNIGNSTQNDNENVELRLPPNAISNVDNFQEFLSYLSRKINNQFLIKLLTKGSYKISTFHIDEINNSSPKYC